MIIINRVSKKRDITIDILRGIAIFTMICANMIPYLLRGTPPKLLRLYGSFAAPTFIFLSGMMVSFTTSRGRHSVIYFLKRGLQLLLIGALLDIFLTGIYPLMTLDVLYLIGLSMPLTFWFKRLKPELQYVIVTGIFAATPFLQNLLGYRDIPLGISIYTVKNLPFPVAEILKQWFVDGWFPLFPWLGFSFAGSICADIRLKHGSFTNIMTLFIIFILLVPGEILWVNNPGSMYIRNGYAELFYPPTPGFILTALGVILLLFYIVDLKNNLKIYKPFSIFGGWSLQIYVSHLIIIALLGKIIEPQNLGIFLLIYVGIFLLLLLFNALEKRRRFSPPPLK